jgi:DNA repair protein RadA/Sms
VSNLSQIENISEICQKEKPMFVFVDSIQTCFSSEVDSAQGTISQIKKCTQTLIDYAKSSNAVVIIVCHVTKSGEIAGPKIMEHMVDVVTYFESDYKNQFRILRSRKNRFGNVDEILVFEMKEKGLEIINNPSAFFIEQDNLEESSVGKCKCVIMEGKRPLIVDIEALVVPSAYPMPKRFSEGIDISRINRILAIIDKHLNENFNNYDVYTNICGGIKTSDIGIDLAIAAAILSSKKKKPIKNNNVFIGELSLTGGIKKVNQVEKRIKEAGRFGCNEVFYQDEKNRLQGIEILKDYFQ